MLELTVFLYCVIQGMTGGTTVSGTMIGAHIADIPVFVTGGIGGVHRGGQTSQYTFLYQKLVFKLSTNLAGSFSKAKYVPFTPD